MKPTANQLNEALAKLIAIDQQLQQLEEHKAKLEARRIEIMLAEVEKSDTFGRPGQ